MSEITREDIQRSLHRIQDGHAVTHTYAWSRAIHELALRALDQEADARLGRRVREVCERQNIRMIANFGTEQSRYELLHEIADALREEQEVGHAE